MIRLFNLFLILFFTFAVQPLFAEVEQASHTVLQKQILACDLNLKSLKKVSNLNQLYNAVDEQYLLISEKIIEREVLYRSRGVDYKLKVNNDKISKHKFDEEGRVIELPIDAKHKVATVKGQVKQLILNAKIDSDWGQYFEVREQGIKVDYSVRNYRISRLKIEREKPEMLLDCQLKNDAEVCNCLKSLAPSARPNKI